MIIVRYGRRPRHAKHALNVAAEDCSLDARVPEMIAESLLIGRLSACLRIASTAPALSISLVPKQRLAKEGRKPTALAKGMQQTTGSIVVSLTSTSALFCGMWFGSPAHLLVALRLRLCAVYAGNWHSLWRLHALDRSQPDAKRAPWAGCVTVREATFLALERRYYVLGRPFWGGRGQSGGVRSSSAISASRGSLRMKMVHWV